MKLLTIALTICVLILVFRIDQLQQRLSRAEEDIGWLDRNFIVKIKDFEDKEGTMEMFVDMQAVWYKISPEDKPTSQERLK